MLIYELKSVNESMNNFIFSISEILTFDNDIIKICDKYFKSYSKNIYDEKYIVNFTYNY